LHLVVIEGPAVLPPAQIPDLVDASGQFPSKQVRQGFDYFFRSRVRAQLAAEIRAQFTAFAATGLTLDHANAHKHMHLHPTIGALLIQIGRDFGLRAVRVPTEPPAVLAACGMRPTLGDYALFRWTALLRWQAHRADLLTNDYCFGIAWSGGMTSERLLRLIPRLPNGLSEIYFHPASDVDPAISALMPDYQHGAELAALLDPEVRNTLRAAGRLTSYSAESRACG
jgi:hopanoid biosynthesis associated protein HpnK